MAAPDEIEWRQLMRIDGGGDENTQHIEQLARVVTIIPFLQELDDLLDLDTESGIVIRRMERPKTPPELEAVEQMVTNEMDPVSILEVLTETEKWLDLHKLFGPLSGFEAKVDDPRKRFITTLFCYGCNLGATQTAR